MTGVLLPKEWYAGVIAIKNRLYVQFKDDGKWKQKATGLLDLPENQAEANAMATDIERRMKAKERQQAIIHSAPRLREYAERWFPTRTGTSGVDDIQRMRQHVLPVLGDKRLSELTVPMVRDLVLGLKLKPSRKGGLLAPRTVLNIYGALHVLCSDAVADGLISITPCQLTDRHLPAKRDKHADWRDTAIFSLVEVLTLVSSEAVPVDRRMFNALMFLGCTRFGEAAELRWADYEQDREPRGKLKVLRSYNTRHKLIKGTKAERPRHVPVVSLLAKMLAEWKLSGWPATFGRLPRPNDLIVPSRGGPSGSAKSKKAIFRQPGNRSVNHMLKRFHEDLHRLKLTPRDEQGKIVGFQRRQHDARRTWFSRVTVAGANETHARWTAWGPSGDLWAEYTTMPWETLCAVVDGLDEAIKQAQRGLQQA